MASSPPLQLPSSLGETLLYFSRYDYPLTAQELWFWQHGTKYPKSKIKLNVQNFEARRQREKISQRKWLIANRVGESLKKIQFVEAIFVTGSLAMSNCDTDADIDLMLITSPNTLWLARPLVYFLLRSIRRKPQVMSAPDKVCDNLYLDTYHLPLTTHNLYLAHEILQAKCIFDRGNTYRRFLLANVWVKKYLPIAYSETLRSLSQLEIRSIGLISSLLYPINFLLFLLQYLYMKPKMTTERVNLGYAFFHPHSSAPTSS